MRRVVLLSVLPLALAAGCGGGSSTSSAPSTSTLAPSSTSPSNASTGSAAGSDYAAVLRASVAKTASTSARMSLDVTSVVAGATTKITGTGVYATAANGPVGDFTLTAAGISGLAERITGGKLYLKVPSQSGWYVLDLKDLVGTSLAESSTPNSAAQVLLAAGKDVKKVGTQTLRGVPTTHYSGTIALADSSAKLSSLAKAAVDKLTASGVTSLPFDAYLDSAGRLRKFVEVVDVTTKGTTAHVTTSFEQYDFGTKVVVVAPPAAEQKDGTSLLTALKGQLGG